MSNEPVLIEKKRWKRVATNAGVFAAGLVTIVVVARWLYFSNSDLRELRREQQRSEELYREEADLRRRDHERTIDALTKLPAAPTTQKPEPVLGLIGLNSEGDENLFQVHGLVRNLTGSPINSVVAVVNYFGENNAFVKTDEGHAKFDPIMPGQTSPFTVITSAHPSIVRYVVQFRQFAGSTLEMVDQRQPDK